MEPEKDEIVAYTHKVIGTIAFAFLLLQVSNLRHQVTWLWVCLLGQYS